MVVVRVREHDDVDPPVPRRDPRVERGDETLGIGPAVDEEAAAALADDEDRVPLADVEHHDVGASVREARRTHDGR
ncbi:MAG: hypothetical protein WCH74_06710, partial [Chloroflexota bacterium]